MDRDARDTRGRLKVLAKRLGRDESAKLARILEGVDRSRRVAEIGCGFGKKLGRLKSLGFGNVCGVEKNPRVAAKAREAGFEVCSPEEFAARYTPASVDMLVFSHVIEHFAWPDLAEFLNRYLDHLRPGGLALFLAPLGHPGFYLDFDHVKPYHPQSIKDFFGKPDEQVQADSRHVLRLVDLYYRRAPFRIRFSRALVLKKNDTLPLALNVALAAAFRVSFGLVGRTTGWMGLFEKKA